MAQNYGLGRGLSSLIPQKKIADQDKSDSSKDTGAQAGTFNYGFVRSVSNPAKNVTEEKKSSKEIFDVDLNEIKNNPYQPRIIFDKEKLSELSESIKSHGIIQPLIVTKKENGYELIAGERRLQAAKLAGLSKVPVIVKEIENKDKLELAIIENIQRHNLNPIEEAKAYHRLVEEFKMSQEDVADKMGKSRSAVANKIRLLNLSIDAVRALNEGKITEGHAKAILSIEDKDKQKILLDLIIKNQLTVRQAENKVKEVAVQAHKRKVSVDPEIRSIEERFSSALGTKVKVKKMGGSGGRIMIDYYSEEELNNLIEKIV